MTKEIDDGVILEIDEMSLRVLLNIDIKLYKSLSTELIMRWMF